MGGGRGAARKDAATEEWAFYRENTLKFFRLTPKNVANIVLFGGVVPYVVYKLCTTDLHSMDRMTKASPKYYWGEEKLSAKMVQPIAPPKAE